MKNVKNAQNGVLWVATGHPRSSAMSSFDRAHMISYSFLIETICLSCTVLEIRRVICRNSPFRPTPPAFSALVGGDSFRISKRLFGSENYSPVHIVRRCLRHHTFSRFGRTPICVRHRLRQRHTHTQIQTQDHGIYRAEHSSRSKKPCMYLIK